MAHVITNKERERRQDAVDFARVNGSLEGFELDQTWEDIAQRFIDGEIEIAQLVGENITKVYS